MKITKIPDNAERLNPVSCAFAQRSMELVVRPCESSFDYMLQFEMAGKPEYAAFRVTKADLVQFAEAITKAI